MEELSKAVPQTLLDFLDRMRVDAVIGAPQQRGEVTVIPVAELNARLGYGFGSGEAPAKAGATAALEAGETATTEAGADADADSEAAADETAAQSAAASGGGGGGGATASLNPRGYIEIADSGARWVPIVDERRTAQAGMILGGWVLFWLLYTVRSIAGTRAARVG